MLSVFMLNVVAPLQHCTLDSNTTKPLVKYLIQNGFTTSVLKVGLFGITHKYLAMLNINFDDLTAMRRQRKGLSSLHKNKLG
jgi:hypothetical protein